MTTKYLGTGKNFGNQRLMAIADPQAETDAINLQSARRLVQGVTSRKEAVRAASTTNVTIASPGTTIDGVTLSNGDRVLLKNQSTASQNGIYDFNGSSSALTRSADADTDAELKSGSQVFVSEGSTLDNTTWQLITNAPIIVGTTGQSWAQTSGTATTYTNGNGLSLTGTTFAVLPDPAGGLAVSASGVAVDSSVIPKKYSVTIGNGASTSIAVTHNLGTRDITFSVYDASTYEFVEVDAVATDTNTLTLTFASAPGSNAYRVVVHG